jgi:hypothetical protein
VGQAGDAYLRPARTRSPTNTHTLPTPYRMAVERGLSVRAEDLFFGDIRRGRASGIVEGGIELKVHIAQRGA